MPLPPIRRLDVARAFLGLFGQALFTAVCHPLLPDATKYAMDVLKHSVHNCYFCHHALPAPLPEEVAFLEARDGPSPTLKRLLELRRVYRPTGSLSVAFRHSYGCTCARRAACSSHARRGRRRLQRPHAPASLRGSSV